MNYAQQALVLDDHHAAAHKWVAIMTSSTGDFKPIKEKLAGAFIIRVGSITTTDFPIILSSFAYSIIVHVGSHYTID